MLNALARKQHQWQGMTNMWISHQKAKQIQKFAQRLGKAIPLVIDSHYVNGLGIIHTLAEIGLNSLAISDSKFNLGASSRYAVGVKCPSPYSDSDAVIEFLLELGRLLPYGGVILLTDDTYLLLLSRYTEELKQFYQLTFLPYPQLIPVMDKWLQMTTANQYGIPIPETYLVQTTDHLQQIQGIQYPLIIKGRFGKDFYRITGKQVVVINHEEDMKQVIIQLAGTQAIVQEFIPGDDSHFYTYGGYFGENGNPIAGFTGRKIHQKPPMFGTCRISESLDHEIVREQGQILLKALNYFGASQVEFKLDPRDNKFKLIEVNARFWLWHSLSAYCGVNIAAYAYQHATGESVVHKEAHVPNKYWLVLPEEIRRFPKDFIKKRSIAHEVIDTLKKPHIDGVVRLSDPIPTIAYLLHHLIS